MGENRLISNIELQIKNADGTSFHNLVLHKFTADSVVMSLGDKITGDVYYKDNTLSVSMQEYVEYNGVKYVLVNPPTIVREGMVKDNSSLKGMTKYAFEFYHPMCALSNIPFTDIAVGSGESKYLSQNKTFSWIGTGYDFIEKLNANLSETEWVVVASTNLESAAKLAELSEVLSFDKVFISDALKTSYDTWKVPFVIDSLLERQYYNSDNVDYYSQAGGSKRFVVVIGLPSNEILDTDGHTPFVFRFGQGVGLKNNSRNSKNNKIVTRIAGYGSENNIPYGYPQIPWTGDQTWEYTINNDSTQPNSYPIYDGIVGGQRVKLIKHPFTRTTLMPSVYSDTVNKKVNPLATGYDPDTVIIDYYDAVDDQTHSYPNNIVAGSPSYESHQFEDIKPELTSEHIVDAYPYMNQTDADDYMTQAQMEQSLSARIATAERMHMVAERDEITEILQSISVYHVPSYYNEGYSGSYSFKSSVTSDSNFYYVKYVSDGQNFSYTALKTGVVLSPVWDDSIDEDGNYRQSYFKIVLPPLSFDLYASAAITQQMSINMRSGDCIGCTFNVQVDWEDYKKNFYDENGNFDPVIGTGHPRNAEKYPNSNGASITVIVQKDNTTFGTLLPDIYRQPKGETSSGADDGDEFVILGISLPLSYISSAEHRLDEASKEYMLENNVYYFDYPLKFDEYFLKTHTNILAQMSNNTVVRFVYGNESPMVLYIKQMTVKYGESPIPQYDITLTDDVEIVLNQIGKTADDVSRVRVQLSELQKYYSQDVINEISNKLSRVADDVAMGRITFQQGLNAVGSIILSSTIQSSNFASGMESGIGRGWRIDSLGNGELESLRIRSFLEVVELLVNRVQAEEGDTVFTDNDQIDYVEALDVSGTTIYRLTLKKKWDGYFTSQAYGNILMGRINTLAAKQAGVSDYSASEYTQYQDEDNGGNKYYTSWLRVTDTHATSPSLCDNNQICVVMYGDTDVPALKNFPPCEMMVVVRRGCIDYTSLDWSKWESEEGQGTSEETIRERIRRRQQVFYLSTSEGRIVKLVGVNKPILENGNYGVTLGIVPDFLWNIPRVASRLIQNRDYLYAQGVIVQDFIPCDYIGNPIATTVHCNDWVDGSRTPITIPSDGYYTNAEGQTAYYNAGDTSNVPLVGLGIYFNMGWNDSTRQYEKHTVRWNNGTWVCLQNQPVVLNNVATYYEPKWGSPYWRLVDGNGRYSMEFNSTNGNAFYVGHVATTVTPYVFYGEVDISPDIAEIYWSWERETEQGKTDADRQWDTAHTQQRVLTLSDIDMPAGWGRSNKAIFTCKCTISDGQNTVIVENQVIA